jgi:hypothetical protein
MSVCSWLLMRTHLLPLLAAKNSIIEVLPTLVGPCKRIGDTFAAMAATMFLRLPSTVAVSTYSTREAASATEWSTGASFPVRIQKGFIRTHSAATDWRPPGL